MSLAASIAFGKEGLGIKLNEASSVILCERR